MHVSEIKNRLKAQPFKPFRIVTSDGDSHEVRHPEFVIVGSDESSRVLYVFEPLFPDSDEARIPPKAISLTHITTLERSESNA